MVNTLELRSHFASLTGTSTRMRTLPSSASSMRETRPMEKPAKVMSMPTTTPSESSETSTRRCVFSNTPRAYITYSAEPATSSTSNISSRAALNSRLRTGSGGVSRGGVVGLIVVGFVPSVIVAHERDHFQQQDHRQQAGELAHVAAAGIGTIRIGLGAGG